MLNRRIILRTVLFFLIISIFTSWLVLHAQKNANVSSAQSWQRHSKNPIITPHKFKTIRNVAISVTVADPSVIYDEEEKKYKMWFATGGDVTPGKTFVWILYAESEDGVDWRVQEEPAFEPAKEQNAWDYTNAETPSVIKDLTAPSDRRYQLWYSGGNKLQAEIKGYAQYQIGLSFSRDGKKFTRLPASKSPYGKEGLVLKAKEALSKYRFDIGVVADPYVIKKDGKFHMWYSSLALNKNGNGVVGGISYSISDDGVHWKSDEYNPVILGGAQPSVIWNKDLRIFEIWYSDDGVEEKKKYPIKEIAEHITLGYWHAVSKDGISWKKTEKRVFGYDLTRENENVGILVGPDVIYKDGIYKMYYSSFGSKKVPKNWVAPFVWALNLATWTPSKDVQQLEKLTLSERKPAGRNLRQSSLPARRPFNMGFTPAEYDAAPEAFEWTYRFLGENADLIAHHFAGGVPWEEAYTRKPYQRKVEENLAYRIQKRTKQQKVFLYLTPLTVLGDDLAGYWGNEENMPRPGKWKQKDFDDPDVLEAYTNFCRDMIKRFSPDYIGYAIEVNNLIDYKPAKWPKFLKLARHIYTKLKAENPNLPLFVSVSVDKFEQRGHKAAIKDILPYSDYIAISTYPYIFGYGDPSKLPENYFSKITTLAPDKPFAVAETGFIARDMDALGLKVAGKEDLQDQYLRRLLFDCEKLNAKFVVWFVPRDYDLLFERIKSMGVSHDIIELFKLFKSTGLLDGSGNHRQAFQTWNRWLKLPKN